MQTLEQLIGEAGMRNVREDQADNSYIPEAGGLAIYANGFYTVWELEEKLRCLKEANALYTEASK